MVVRVVVVDASRVVGVAGVIRDAVGRGCVISELPLITDDKSHRRLWSFKYLDLTRPHEHTVLRLALKVLNALHGSIVLAHGLEPAAQSSLLCQTRASATHSSTPTHFPAENFGLAPVHLTYPTPADTWTLAPSGTSGVVILLAETCLSSQSVD